MFLCPMPRTKLLRFLPAAGEVAEIGVAEGDFSQEILSGATPRLLHLVDPWIHQAREDYTNDPNNVTDTAQGARYESVLQRFREPIAGGRVRVHRGYSHEVADEFEAGRFDWVYVDAMHTADAVYRDLVAWHDTVRHDGFIAGHDYTNHVQAQSWNFGVVEAVNRFVAEFGYAFIALTMEAFPTYVLAKDPRSPAAVELGARLIAEVPYVAEIRDFPQGRAFEHKALQRGDTLLVYPSF